MNKLKTISEYKREVHVAQNVRTMKKTKSNMYLCVFVF